MADFGKREPRSTPAASLKTAPVGRAGAAKGALAFSFPALLCALVVSTLMTFIAFTYVTDQFRELIAANPDVVEDVEPGEIALLAKWMRWTAVVLFCLEAICYCFLAHRASKYFDNGEFWLFALAGLLSAFVLCIVTGALPGPMKGAAYTLIHGLAVTSTYWLVANWREA